MSTLKPARLSQGMRHASPPPCSPPPAGSAITGAPLPLPSPPPLLTAASTLAKLLLLLNPAPLQHIEAALLAEEQALTTVHVAVTKQLRRLEVRRKGGLGWPVPGCACRPSSQEVGLAIPWNAVWLQRNAVWSQVRSHMLLPPPPPPCLFALQAEEQLLQEILKRAEHEEAEQQQQQGQEGAGQQLPAQVAQPAQQQGKQRGQQRQQRPSLEGKDE